MPYAAISDAIVVDGLEPSYAFLQKEIPHNWQHRPRDQISPSRFSLPRRCLPLPWIQSTPSSISQTSSTKTTSTTTPPPPPPPPLPGPRQTTLPRTLIVPVCCPPFPAPHAVHNPFSPLKSLQST